MCDCEKKPLTEEDVRRIVAEEIARALIGVADRGTYSR